MRRALSWQLSVTLPLVVAGLFTLDVTSRLLPAIDIVAIRAWDVMVSDAVADGPYTPNKKITGTWVNDGDLGLLGNLPPLSEYHTGTFTTDAYGYRNAPEIVVSGEPANVIMVGTSFTGGANVSDEETLSAQLSRLTGYIAYNAAPTVLPGTRDVVITPDRVRSLANRLGIRDGFVIYEVLERYDLPPLPFSMSTDSNYLCNRALSPFAGPADADKFCRWMRTVRDTSPLQTVARRYYRTLQDDQWLPNIYAEKVAEEHLDNGEVMRFLVEDIQNYRRHRPVEQTAQYIKWVTTDLDKDRLKVLVVLVPDKYVVYGPLLASQNRMNPSDPIYFDDLEQQLKSRGICVVNLTATFRSRAASDLQKGQFIYLRDDTHWNARGIALAAAEIARAMSEGC